MTRTIHVALSVDVDRFSDAKIRREYLPHTSIDGRRATVAEFRAACAEARAAGLEVFPPCDHTGPDGRCLGHPNEEERPS